MQSDNDGTRFVSRPLSEDIDLKISDKHGLLCDTNTQVPKDVNNIRIKEFSVFSLAYSLQGEVLTLPV